MTKPCIVRGCDWLSSSNSYQNEQPLISLPSNWKKIVDIKAVKPLREVWRPLTSFVWASHLVNRLRVVHGCANCGTRPHSWQDRGVFNNTLQWNVILVDWNGLVIMWKNKYLDLMHYYKNFFVSFVKILRFCQKKLKLRRTFYSTNVYILTRKGSFTSLSNVWL